MEDFKQGKLKLTIEEDDSKIILKWLGESRDMDPARILDPYLNNILKTIKGKSLIIDFKELNSMNSSTVLPILNFIKSLESASIHTEIIYDETCSWQRASFVPLSAITKYYKYIKVKKFIPE